MQKRPLVFIVEDEKKMREILRINLTKRYEIGLFEDAESAYKGVKQTQPDIIVSDVRLPGIDGIEFMKKVRTTYPDIPFIVVTGYGSIDHAVESMKKGAFDYLTKPIKIENLVQSIDRALSYLTVYRSNVATERSFDIKVDNMELEFITRDPATIQVLNLAKKASQFKSPILIVGETGTGKELVARYIHANSRRKGLFVKINCASIPKDILEGELFGYSKGAFTGADHDYEGKIALSNGGTLFLDEIGELPLDLQAKLLHVLEIPEYYPLGSNKKKKVDLNLITATNRNLRALVDTGGFRRDLYYRIAVIPLRIPPLRERRGDILPIAEYFLQKQKKEALISPEVKLKLLEYSWPGNIRELKNIIDRSVLFLDKGKVIREVMFDPDESQPSTREQVTLQDEIPENWEAFKKYKSKIVKDKKSELERMFIEKLLIKHNGNVSASARDAGLDRRQFQDLIKSLHIDTTLFRSK